jgi:hypothetical protein
MVVDVGGAQTFTNLANHRVELIPRALVIPE